MVRAVKAVRGKTIVLLKASNMLNVPRITLKEIGMILPSTVSALWIFPLRGEERDGCPALSVQVKVKTALI
jgi:hypothetical protein